MTQQRIQAIHEQLSQALHTTHLEIIDQSKAHVGHAGAQPGLLHLVVRIQSPMFKSQSLIQCHRFVYDALGTMMKTDIHALKIEIIPD